MHTILFIFYQIQIYTSTFKMNFLLPILQYFDFFSPPHFTIFFLKKIITYFSALHFLFTIDIIKRY